MRHRPRVPVLLEGIELEEQSKQATEKKVVLRRIEEASRARSFGGGLRLQHAWKNCEPEKDRDRRPALLEEIAAKTFVARKIRRTREQLKTEWNTWDKAGDVRTGRNGDDGGKILIGWAMY